MLDEQVRLRGFSLPLITGAGVLSLLISVVPFYGYFAHAGRDEQWYFLVILGCWLASIGLGLGSVVVAVVLFRRDRTRLIALLGIGVVLLVVSVFSWGGVVDGFKELVAG